MPSRARRRFWGKTLRILVPSFGRCRRGWLTHTKPEEGLSLSCLALSGLRGWIARDALGRGEGCNGLSRRLAGDLSGKLAEGGYRP